MKPALTIMGIRGVPAQHGGFETFAEHLALFLAGRGWDVTVYCQEEGKGPVYESDWQGIHRIHIPVSQGGAPGTIVFDLRAIVHSLGRPGVILTLGYNTAVFNVLHRLWRMPNLINMDGIEWKRGKWGALAKTWFWLNERIGCLVGNHLVADHPRIGDHLATRVSRDKITMIPYGADAIDRADAALLQPWGLQAGEYSVVIARAEPENSLLEIVSAFSARPRGHRLVVLGNYDTAHNAYHRAVKAAASQEVLFPGAIYDPAIVKALRFYARFYLHGHQVGGTNPSLVEALGAGNAIIAHDNPFNRWVAGEAGLYFSDRAGCEALLDRCLGDVALLEEKRQHARAIFTARFRWPDILAQYETLLQSWA